MPNTRSDHEFKKKLIGNDFVIIVYNESDYAFDMKTLKVGQILLAFRPCKSNFSPRAEFVNMLWKCVHRVIPATHAFV